MTRIDRLIYQEEKTTSRNISCCFNSKSISSMILYTIKTQTTLTVSFYIIICVEVDVHVMNRGSRFTRIRQNKLIKLIVEIG